ncbi:MFS transporter [Rhizobium rhizosphaerae]|uniref:MFS transporter n=1 Tax=Xaviernesmea rhizosphaerae TaxID=1672749 RepID=A0A1Q9AFX3_9HYPH|nr:MFS transporter [Xaviernesmea rhizosphaerae]
MRRKGRRHAQPEGRPLLPRRTLLAYALPAAPLAALGLPLYALVPTYYVETVGLPVAAVGWVVLMIRLVDAVSDPAVGLFADRIRPRFGRRRSLFLSGLPVTALAAIMLYRPPDGAGLVWLGLWGALVSIGFTLVQVPYSAWGAELVRDYHGRTRLAAWRESVTVVGTLIAIALPFSIGFAPGQSGLALLGFVTGGLLILTGLLAVASVPEPEAVGTAGMRPQEGLRLLAENRPFRRLILAYFVNGLANGIPATLFLIFVSARLDLESLRGPLLFLYFLSAIAGVPLASAAARRFGKHRAWCAGMVLACLIFALTPLLPAGAALAFGLICFSTGLLLGFDLALPPAIQADVIDADGAGPGRAGFYFAAWGLATKLSLAAGAALTFPLLGLFGFDPARGSANDATALMALAMLYAWLPVVLKFIAIALMWRFPLDETAHRNLQG